MYVFVRLIIAVWIYVCTCCRSASYGTVHKLNSHFLADVRKADISRLFISFDSQNEMCRLWYIRWYSCITIQVWWLFTFACPQCTIYVSNTILLNRYFPFGIARKFIELLFQVISICMFSNRSQTTSSHVMRKRYFYTKCRYGFCH